MKKFLVLWFVCLFILSCRGIKGQGFIVDKGIDKIDITAMMDGIQIKPTDADEKYQELYWLKIRGVDNKVFVNQFCYETSEIGGFIILGPENEDIRFITEY
jgi:hypothetical protein